MASPNPQQAPLPPEQRLAREQQERYQRMTRNLAIGGLVICPIVALMPPRKLDFYTFSLGVGFYFSADHLCTLRTGRGLYEQLLPAKVMDLPTEKARETQRRIAEEREKGRKMLDRKDEGEEKKDILHRLWMGGEKEDWKERRLEEERKAFEEGKTFSDMILEQIWEVWNWDKKKNRKRDDERKE